MLRGQLTQNGLNQAVRPQCSEGRRFGQKDESTSTDAGVNVIRVFL